MRLFFDQLHVQMLPDGRVALSVRVNDNRVDEYHLDASVVWAMLEAAAPMPGEWVGPDEVRVKFDLSKQLVGLSFAVGENKREVHRVGLSPFEVMAAQFRSQAVGG